MSWIDLAKIENILAAKVQLTTTAINLEEQLRERLAQVAEAIDGRAKSIALHKFVGFFNAKERGGKRRVTQSFFL